MAEPAVAAAPRERKDRPQRPPPVRPAATKRAPVGIPPAVGRLPIAPGPGEPLRPEVAKPVAASLGVDVSPVRVHADVASSEAADALGARAFTVGSDVFLGRSERPTDLPLVAHEVAHVVQQKGAPRLQRWLRRGGGGDHHEREAHRASAAVVARRPFTVRERTTPRVQRLGISDALDYFADKANIIPGFRMFTIILGVNPINMSRVERSAANILRAVVEFIPGGGLITQALDNYGVFEKAGAWIEKQLDALGLSWSLIKDAIDRFLDSLGWSDIFHLGDVWDRAKRIFTDPIDRIIKFLGSLVTGILKLIKDAILKPLAKLAEGTRGWDLLTAVLGENPITGEPVPRTAETLIGGFMKLIGQEEVWENIKRANAIARAWAWFQGALSGLLGFVRAIPGMFISALQSLELADIVLLPRAFMKVGRVFLGFLGEFLSWAGRQVLSLLQIIFEVLAPAVMPYLRKAMGAFRTIIGNPIRFIGHLVRAGIQGFRQFADNFLNHLRRSLIDWLTGTLSGAGIYIPQAFELREIVKFVLSVLGLTWQNIRTKLVRVIGEPAVTALETAFDIVVTLVREGPAAAWEKIREQLANLREMVMEQIMTFVRERIVQAAITRLVTSLNPVGAFIQAIIAIYNTVMFFVERLRQIAQVAMSFIDSIAAIASGAIGQAANRVEQTMAGLLTLVISFLARLVGLGRVSDVVVNIVNRIRAPIDRALDFVVNWIVNAARAIGRLVMGGVRGAVGAVAGWWRARKSFRAGTEPHTLYFRGEGASAVLVIATSEQPYRSYVTAVNVTATDQARAAAKQTALAKLAAIEQLKTRNLDDGQKTQEFNRLLDELAAATVTLLSGSAALPESTPPVYGGASAGGFATTMTANVLTSKGPEGTSPAELSGRVWDILSRRRERPGAARRFYKLGHLLSFRLHGPGDTWRNLTPQSESGNQSFERGQGERQAKAWVNEGKGIRYSVTAIYGRSANKSAIVARWQAAKDPQLREKRQILDAEDSVATEFRYSYQVIFENGAFVQGRTPVTGSAPNDIRQEPDKYHLG